MDLKIRFFFQYFFKYYCTRFSHTLRATTCPTLPPSCSTTKTWVLRTRQLPPDPLHQPPGESGTSSRGWNPRFRRRWFCVPKRASCLLPRESAPDTRGTAGCAGNPIAFGVESRSTVPPARTALRGPAGLDAIGDHQGRGNETRRNRVHSNHAQDLFCSSFFSLCFIDTPKMLERRSSVEDQIRFTRTK